MKDTLGNKIELGSLYCYSRINNGIYTVIIGVATEINELTGKVRMSSLQKGTGIKGDEVRPETASKSISGLYAGYMLVKIDGQEINWKRI